jgi:DNA-binding response OmpR family regulator
MKQVIKKLRSYENLNLLIISKDDIFNEEVKKIFTTMNMIVVVDTNEKALKKCKKNTFNVIIINTKSDNYVELFNKLDKQGKPSVKIIVINENKEEDVIRAINSEAYAIFLTPFNISNIDLAVKKYINQAQREDKFKLGEGFYFDQYRDKVYSKTGRIVELTKLEYGVLKLIMDNKGKIVSYDQIHKNVWKEKPMSVFTMRNIVNKLRVKIHSKVFDNVSSKGYKIQ